MANNKLNVKIRPTVLSIFIILTSLIIFITLVLQYYFLKDLALNATNDNIKHISEKIKEKTNNLDKNNINIVFNLQYNKSIDTFVKQGERHPLLRLLTKTLENNTYLYSLYVGNENADFYQVVNLNINERLKKQHNTNASWLVVKIYNENGERIRYREYLNNNLQVIKTQKQKAIYNPSVRPWYIQAMNSDDIIKTPPYIYTSLQAYGLTYAKKLSNSNSVIGLDVSLDSMSSFLKKQLSLKNSEIYLFRENAEIISKAKLTNTKNEKRFKREKMPYLSEAEIKKISTSNPLFVIKKINGDDFYFYTSLLDENQKDKEFLSVILPLDVIMKPYDEKIFYSSLITLTILLLTIPFVTIGTKLLISPIHKLADENHKITNRQFSEVKHIETNIKELNDLSISLVELSESIQKYEEDQRKQMDSFIKLIASAIDAKSKYTGGHCERVPVLSMMIAKEASDNNDVFKDFKINNSDEEREINVAAWLHDCGKVTTPEYVVDKAVKLETIYNRIHEIRTRFEVIYRDMTISSLQRILNGASKKEEKEKLQKEHEQLINDFKFIAQANIGGEFMSDEDINKVKNIGNRTWTRYFDNSIGISKDEKERLSKTTNKTPQVEKLLSDKSEHIIPRDYSLESEYKEYGFKLEVPKHLYNLGEIYNLSIRKGTLTNEERYKINEHSVMSIIMLKQLPFLENLKNVPEFAGAHHETLIGTGYPRKLTKEQMSLPSRIIAVADVFEALTSSDRPYKEAKTLSQSIKILSFMVKDKHLDEDVFKMFLKSGIYKTYAQKYLEKEQIDEVNINDYI